MPSSTVLQKNEMRQINHFILTMPGAVAPYLAYEASVASGTTTHVKLDFPILTITGEKAIVNEIIGFDWDPNVDAGDTINATAATAQTVRSTMILSKRELTDAETVTYTSKLGPGNTSVIGKAAWNVTTAFLDSDAATAVPIAAPVASAFPWWVSLIRGETGYILPQEFLWLNFEQTNPAAAARRQSIRIFFYQRTLPARNYLTLLQNDIQLG